MLKIQEHFLLNRVKNGDQTAFAKLYDEYATKIQRFVYFKVSDRESTQDITNEVFIKILNYLADGGQINNFQSFLYRTARNLIIDFYRTRRPSEPLEQAGEIIIKTDFDQNIDQKIIIENVKKYLGNLKPEYQEAVLLRFFDDLSIPEIAEVIDESEANVRQRVHRGVKMLKECLRAADQRE